MVTLKTQTTPNVCKAFEKQEEFSAGQNVKWYRYFGR
jgi:hypothetical protein